MEYTPECVGVVGRWYGHEFKGRWSTEERPSGAKVHCDSGEPSELRGLIVLTNSTYEGDVCTRCGRREFGDGD